MKRIKVVFSVGCGLIMSSCICFPPISVEFVNQTSTPVTVSYSTKNMNADYSIYYDTISRKIEAGSRLELEFQATYNNSRKRLSKCIPFFKFETPTKSICFEGPKEVIKVLNKNSEFFISDSLFTSR